VRILVYFELMARANIEKVPHDKSPELVTLALTTLGSFDFSGEYYILSQMPR
jgi:hypothetical protein